MADEKPGSRLDELNLGDVNYVKEALQWQYNWIGVAGALAFAVVSGSGLPLVLAAGLELIYVAVVPQSSRFRRLVRSWKYAEEKKKHEMKLHALFQELPEPMQSRYANLMHTIGQIKANYDKLSASSQIFVSQMDAKLQSLLHGYVRLLHASHQQQQYIQSCNPTGILREAKQLEDALPKEPEKVQEINRKRIEILKKRLEKFHKIRENWQVVQAQTAATEDVLELIRDQSMTMRDPQELTYRIDTLVQDVEQTESTVREMESLFDMTVADLSSDSIPPLPPVSEPQRPRNRVRN